MDDYANCFDYIDEESCNENSDCTWDPITEQCGFKKKPLPIKVDNIPPLYEDVAMNVIDYIPVDELFSMYKTDDNVRNVVLNRAPSLQSLDELYSLLYLVAEDGDMDFFDEILSIYQYSETLKHKFATYAVKLKHNKLFLALFEPFMADEMLLYASESDNVDMIAYLLSNGGAININNLLDGAILAGNTEWINIALNQYRASVTYRTMIRLVQSGNIALLRQLWQSGMVPVPILAGGARMAGLLGSRDMIDFFVGINTNLLVDIADGEIERGVTDAFERYLQEESDPHMLSANMGVLIYAAARHGHMDIVNRIFDVHVENVRNLLVDALYGASGRDREMFDYIRDHIFEAFDIQVLPVNILNIAVNEAARVGNVDMVNYLRELGADNDAFILLGATESNNRVLIDDVLTRNPNIHVDILNEALDVAAAEGNEELIRLFIDAGADDINSALERASMSDAINNTNIVRILIEVYGADDLQGARDAAYRAQQRHIVRLLDRYIQERDNEEVEFE